MAITKALKAAGKAASKKIKENQKKPFNELMSKDKTQQKEAGMGTESKTRLKLGELGGRTSGQAQSLRQKIKQLRAIEDKDSEKARLLESAISDLRKRLPLPVVKKVMKSLDNDMNKGGAVNKAQMMRGGMANKKEHMYAAGGAVMDNLTSAQKNMVKKMAAANKK